MEREVKKHSSMGEVCEGGKGPHWNFVTSKVVLVVVDQFRTVSN